MDKKYFVYIIKSDKNGKIYTGFTTDLENRIKQHNEDADGYTNKKGPWKIIWNAVFNDRQLAGNFERYLKSGSGIAFARKRLIGL